jgi:hypothetical protein
MVFLPQNTQCISVVKIIAFLELKQKLTFFKGLPKGPTRQAGASELTYSYKLNPKT